MREGGETKEISREEWDRAFLGREPVRVIPDEGDNDVVFEANVTHNLNTMAAEAGIYYALWRPGEMLDPEKSALIEEEAQARNYHGAGGVFELEGTLPVVHARDLIEPLTRGLTLLKSDPERFKRLNPENGWGSYAGFVPWVERYLHACERWPDAEVRVSR